MTAEPTTFLGLECVGEGDGVLVSEVAASIRALQDAGALQGWHRGLVAAVIHAARDAERLGGIARTKQLGQVKDILKSLPEPSVRESDELVDVEAARIVRFLAGYCDEVVESDVDVLQSTQVSSPVWPLV